MLVTLRGPKVCHWTPSIPLASKALAKANCRIPMVSSTLDFLMSKSCGEQIMSEFSIVMTEETLKVVLSFPM